MVFQYGILDFFFLFFLFWMVNEVGNLHFVVIYVYNGEMLDVVLIYLQMYGIMGLFILDISIEGSNSGVVCKHY